MPVAQNGECGNAPGGPKEDERRNGHGEHKTGESKEGKGRTMRRRKALIAVIIALAVATAIAVPAVAQKRVEVRRMECMDGPGMGMGRPGMGKGHPGMGTGHGPALTSEQQEQADAIREKYDDQRVELVNRLKAMAIEADDAFDGDAPDFAALEKQIDEAAKVRADMAKLKLRMHKEIRGILTEDQRTIFDHGLSSKFGRGLMMGGQGHGGMRGDMGRGCRGMRGGGRASCGMMGGMGPGSCGMMGGFGMGGEPMIWEEKTEDGTRIRKMIFIPEGAELPEGHEMHEMHEMYFETDHDGDSEGHSSL